MTDPGLSSRVALVTGAGGAIGQVAVQELLELGAGRVYACGRRESALLAVRELDPERVLPLPMDVAEPSAWTVLTDAVRRDGRPVGILVTSAGINRRGPFLDTDPNDWAALWRVNVFGTMLAVWTVLPGMLAGKFGRIVAISSVGARKAITERAPYAATKGAVEAFVRSVAAEVAGSGVTVNALAPGVFFTELTRAWLTARPDMVERTLAQIPEGRFGGLTELAGALRYLVTSPYSQGSTVDVDGGWAIG